MDLQNMIEAPPIELFVPGRLCLFGEHSDWAGGYRAGRTEIPAGFCVTVGTDQGIRARARRSPGHVRLTSRLPDGRERTLEAAADVDALARIARDGGFWCHAAGTAAELLANHPVEGLELAAHTMTLPLRKGLSSSAAVCVLVARAFGAVHGLELDPRAEMELAYRGERRTPSRCGRMDQICAYGPVPCALTFDGDSLRVEPVRAGADLHLLIADLGAAKDTVRILRELDAHFPDATGAVAEGVRRGLGAENRRIGEAAVQALERGDAPALGGLMTEAQAVFDRRVAPGCPAELTAPRLHAALAHPGLDGLVWGGKGVGSQGDGMVQFLARGEAERSEARRILARDLGLEAIDLTVNATA
jgi:galactokinase